MCGTCGLFYITGHKAAIAKPILRDTLEESVYLQALLLGVRAQVYLVFVSVHHSILYI